MKDDLKRFKEDGSNPKHAKHFNNVIDGIYFDIPLEQVKIKLLRQMKINMRSDFIDVIFLFIRNYQRYNYCNFNTLKMFSSARTKILYIKKFHQ